MTFEVKNGVGSLEHYPIDESSLIWTFEPLDRQSQTINVKGGANGKLSFDGQFSQKGRYKVTVSGTIHSQYNSKLYTGESSQIITIAEDLAPKTNLALTKIMLRDIKNGNLTALKATSTAISLDGDEIEELVYTMQFDSDNDLNFDEEVIETFTVGKEPFVIYLTDHVGRYRFNLTAKESFGQPTIEEFVTDADRRVGDTFSLEDAEKTIHIINTPPIIDLDVSKRKQVSLLVYNDFDIMKMSDFESKSIC